MAKAKPRSSIGAGGQAVAGGGFAGLPVDGERLARDPVAMRRDRRFELGRRAVAHADPVGVVEPGLLARRLQAVDHLARPALGDELRREPRVEGDEELAVVGRRHPLLLDQPDLEIVGQQHERLAVDLDLDPAVARQRLGERIAVGGEERRLRRLHLAAELLAEDAEVGPHLVGDEIAAPFGEEDVLDVQLVEDEPADPLELRPHVDAEDLRGEDEGRRSERLTVLEVVLGARHAPEADDALREAHGADEREPARGPISRIPSPGPVSRDGRSAAPRGPDRARGARAASRRGTE